MSCKKLSGYQNRKRKAANEQQLEKQRIDIKKFLISTKETPQDVESGKQFLSTSHLNLL